MPEHHERTRFRIHHANSTDEHEALLYVHSHTACAAVDFARRVLGIDGLAASPVDPAGHPLHQAHATPHRHAPHPHSLEG